jgi:hypothetical protein
MRLVPVLVAAALALPTAGCRQLLGLHDLDGDAPAATQDSPRSDALLVDATPADAPGSGWWDTAWPTRLPIVITNGSSDALPAGFQIRLQGAIAAVPCASVAPFPDVRFTFGTAELPRAFDDQTGTLTAVWLRLVEPLAGGATSTGEYWLYCGNGSAATPPGAEATVFDFWDPFETLDLTTWTAVGSASISAANFLNASGSGGIDSKTAFPYTQHAVDFVARTNFSSPVWWGGFENGAGDERPWVLWYTNMPNALEPSYVAAASGASIVNGAMTPLDNAQHIYGIEGFADHAVFERDDVTTQSLTYGSDFTPPATSSLRLWNNSSTGKVEFHWVRTRQAIDPPPAVNVGSAEQLMP